MNKKGVIHIKKEKSRLPLDVRGSKMPVLKLPIVTRKGKAMTGKWVIRVHVQRDIFFALTGSKLFYQFRLQGFPKLADDGTGSMRDISFEVLFQSMNDFCVVID